MATTQQMIDEVKQDFVQSSLNCSWSDAEIVRALNEGYQHLMRAILRRDYEGMFFGVEKDFSYTAAARSVVMSSKFGFRPLMIHRVLNADDSYKEIPNVPLRDEYTAANRLTGYYFMVDRLNLYIADEGVAPTAALNLRVRYTPTPILMEASGNVTDRSGASVVYGTYEPDFIHDQYQAIVSYAVVRLSMAEQQPTAEQQNRFNQIEQDVVQAALDGLQTQDSAEVHVTNTTDYEVYE